VSPAPPTLGLVLVVGIGSPDRGDDAWGPRVAQAVAELGLTGVQVMLHEDPTDLVQAWDTADLAVVVDAVDAGLDPGGLVVREMGADADGLPSATFARVAVGGTHAFGLAAAIELSRALGRLPRRVVLVGTQVASVAHGMPMAPEVSAAVGPAVDRVRHIVTSSGTSSATASARVAGAR